MPVTAELMTCRCDTCGFQSDVSGFFRKERGGFRRRPTWVCAGCAPFRPNLADAQALSGAAVTLILLAFAVFRYVIDFGSPIEGVTFLLGVALCLPLAVFLHEMGHALVARALGRRILGIRIGGGPLVGSFRVLGAVLDWRRHAFLGGAVSYDTGAPASRWANALIAAAGPLSNFALAGLLAVLPAVLPEAGEALPLSAACVGAALTSAYVGVVNLLVFQHEAADLDGVHSDGAQILAAFARRASIDPPTDETLQRAKAERCKQLRRFDEAADIYEALLADRPRDLVLLSLLLHVIDRGRGPAAALDRYEALVPHGPPGPMDWNLASADAVLRANVVWMALKAGGEARLAAAERLAPLPLQGDHAYAVVVATQGALEVRRGDVEAGEPLLLVGVRADEVELEDRADFCAFLAEGRRLRGDEPSARAFEALARRLRARI